MHELKELRQIQERHEHDLKDHAKRRICVGCSDVCATMAKVLYRRGLRAEHGINPSAHVVRMRECVPTMLVLVTIHGVIRWAHHEAPNFPVFNAFDRTFTLVPGGPAGFQIANDLVSLRPLEGDSETSAVLWMPSNAQFVLRHVTDGAANSPEIVSAIIEQCATDLELAVAKNEVNTAGPAVLGEAWAASGGEPQNAIKIARVVGRTGCPVGAAVEALKSNNSNLDAASAAVAK